MPDMWPLFVIPTLLAELQQSDGALRASVTIPEKFGSFPLAVALAPLLLDEAAERFCFISPQGRQCDLRSTDGIVAWQPLELDPDEAVPLLLKLPELAVAAGATHAKLLLLIRSPADLLSPAAASPQAAGQRATARTPPDKTEPSAAEVYAAVRFHLGNHPPRPGDFDIIER